MDQQIQFDASYPCRRVAERSAVHTTVVTVIEPAIRSKLDAATSEYFSSVHANSVNEAIRVVRETAARAFIVSPRAIAVQELGDVRQAITRCPGLMTVALIGDHEPKAMEGLLTLGTQGVRRIVDLSYPDGWSKLRTLITESGGEIAKVILEAIVPALGETTDGTRYFFDCLVHLAPTVVTARQLADELDIGTGAMTSRFYRAGLPAPKRYLAEVRLLYAMALFRDRRVSVANVAHRLRFSSPQTFSRGVRMRFGVTPSELREQYPFACLLDRFLDTLIRPFAEVFRTIDLVG